MEDSLALELAARNAYNPDYNKRVSKLYNYQKKLANRMRVVK